MNPNQHPRNAEQDKERIATNAKLFFSTWAQIHEAETPDTKFLGFHPSQDLDTAKIPAIMPNGSETPADLAQRIRFVFRNSFKENEPLRDEFFKALDRPYPHESRNGRTYLEVLEQDYLADNKGVAIVLGHIDNGVSDVPRVTGLVRTRLLEVFGDKYVDRVGEIASKTLTYEEMYGVATAELISILGNTYYTVPDTDRIEEILSLSGISRKDLEEVKDYINNRAIRPIKRDLHDGHLIVISPSGTKAKHVPSLTDEPDEVIMGTIRSTSARLSTSGKAIFPMAVVEDRIELGEIHTVHIAGGRDERLPAAQELTEASMEEIAFLANKIYAAAGVRKVARYMRSEDLLAA